MRKIRVIKLYWLKDFVIQNECYKQYACYKSNLPAFNFTSVSFQFYTMIYKITFHGYLNDTFEIIGERDNNMHYLLFHAMEKSD